MANILETIVEEKKREVAKLPARIIAAGDLIVCQIRFRKQDWNYEEGIRF